MTTLNTSGTIRISVAYNGAQGNSGSAVDNSDVSGDGRFVTFNSYATNLTPGDGNGTNDVFLRDTLTGASQLVSIGTDGSVGNAYSYPSSVSDDGRFVAFASTATNLVPGDTGTQDIFLRDMQSGSTIKLTQASDGATGNNDSFTPHITGDGRFVVYDSFATNLVAGDVNGFRDIFLHDVLTGDTSLISQSSVGLQGDGISFSADISADARFVSFTSGATNLVSGDTNGVDDIFLRDTLTSTTTRVSVGTAGEQGDGSSSISHVSDSGRYVAFQSFATNFVSGDTNGTSDVFLRDTVAGTTNLVSVSSTGGNANGLSYGSDISPDGRYVVFQSNASNLVSGDTNGFSDIFLRDTVAGTTVRLSVGLGGVEANSSSGNAHISADGHYVTFDSLATNLILGDTNGQRDVFRVSLVASNAADYLIGSDKADAISGLGGADIINGGLGADTMNGGSGNDTVYVDNAGDTVIEAVNGGTDTILTSVSYAIAGGGEVEFLKTTDATALTAINLTGNGFAQTLIGNAGANTLNGLGGADTMYGLGGNDVYVVDDVGDRAIEAIGQGTDTVVSMVSYALETGQSIETLQLSSGTGSTALNLTGNEIANTLRGNSGANVLEGRGGADILYGNLGADTFRFNSFSESSAASPDRIADFSHSQGDRIDLHLIDANTTASATGDQAFAFTAGNGTGAFTNHAGELRYQFSGADTLVQADTDGNGTADLAILLTGHVTLAIADFIL